MGSDEKDEQPVPTRDADHWTLDKKVPIAIIIAMLTQFAGAIWMVSRLNSDVLELQKADARFEAVMKENRDRVDRVDAARNAGEMRLVRVEEQIRQIYETVKRIDDRMERLPDRRPSP
jgi:septal ring factor EnvC (AmiA/AmiB activator)